MIGIDFNLHLTLSQYTFMDLLKGLANACWTNNLFATVRLSSQQTIRQMRPEIPRQPSDKNIFLFRSISVHGVCPDNLSSKSSRHRKLSSSNAAETLPLRHSRNRVTQYIGKCERASRLENIRRLRTGVNKQSQNALHQRRLWHSTEPRGLCSGFNNHRFMYDTVSMGTISQTQSRDQATYSDELKRLYTNVYPHYRRKSPRCKYPRRADFGIRGYLCHGSRVPRLCSSFYFYSKPFNFCYKSQNQFRLSSSLLSPSRQNNRPLMRPDNNAQRFLSFAELSCRSSSNRLLRYRNKQKIHLPNEQLYTGRTDNRPTLQVPLADRNFFQMDQTVPANQNVFRHQCKRRENSNLDCYQRLRFGSDCQERTQNRAEFRRNLTNPQHRTFRESLYYTSAYENYVAKRKYSVS